jgi:hypothetical protein
MTGTTITKQAYLGRALSYAEAQYREGPDNHNRFSELLGRDKEYWCADFEVGVAKELDSAHFAELIPNTGSCLNAIDQWRRRGQWHQGFAGINAGDIAYLGSNGGQHTFIVVSLAGTSVKTVEGNTNNDGSSNGDGVYAKTRSMTGIFGYGRPNYAVNKSTYVTGVENWNDISRKFKMTLDQLRALNGSLTALKPGTTIRIS